MSLSAWEQQALESIKDALARSSPALAARLAMFSRLACGEEMPAREKIQAGSRRPLRRPGPQSRRRRRARVYRRFGAEGAVLLVWLTITAVLITVALVCNRDGAPGARGAEGACTGYWATLCGSATSAPR